MSLFWAALYSGLKSASGMILAQTLRIPCGWWSRGRCVPHGQADSGFPPKAATTRGPEEPNPE